MNQQLKELNQLNQLKQLKKTYKSYSLTISRVWGVKELHMKRTNRVIGLYTCGSKIGHYACLFLQIKE